MGKNRTMAIKHAKARKDACKEGIRRALDDAMKDYPYKDKLHGKYKSIFMLPAIDSAKAQKLEKYHGIPYVEERKNNDRIVRSIDGIPYDIDVARMMYKYHPECCPEFELL